MKIGIVIQARMGSSRLPGKILKPFYKDKNILSIIVERMKKIENVDVVVATSTSSQNDEMVDMLTKSGVEVYRGEENDVLKRYIGAAEKYHFEGIVRICSDNPFMDYYGIVELVKKSRNCSADYIGFRINDTPSIKTHFGFWGEFVTLNTLKRVSQTTDEMLYHEHVTNYIYTHSDNFKIEWIDCPQYIQGKTNIRLTIDNQQDFDNACQVYKELYNPMSEFSLQDIVNYLERNQDITLSMEQQIKQNSK